MPKVPRKKTKIDDRRYWVKRHAALLAEITASHPNATTVQQRALCESLAWQLVDREKIETRVGPTDDPLPESHATLCNSIRRGFNQLEGRADEPDSPVFESKPRRVGRPTRDESAYRRYVEHCNSIRLAPENFEEFLDNVLMYGRFIAPAPDPVPAPRAAYLRATVPQPVAPAPITQDEKHETKIDASLSPDTYAHLFDVAFGKSK